jgi:hypothetical protein
MHTRERERERVTWSNEVEEHESIVFEVIVSDSMVCRFYWRERESEREREREREELSWYCHCCPNGRTVHLVVKLRRKKKWNNFFKKKNKYIR